MNKAVRPLATELSNRLYFIVQIEHKTLGWINWTPESVVQPFAFQMDAEDEAERARELYFVKDVRVVRVSETLEIVNRERAARNCPLCGKPATPREIYHDSTNDAWGHKGCVLAVRGGGRDE